jgi:4-hydroxybenzoate polyprenyltransferase
MLRLLRPRQWIKSSFVLAPLLFSGRFTDPEAVVNALLATGIFSLVASATYIVNDLRDIESDRMHPVKSRSRPLAAGEVTPRAAVAVLAALVVLIAVGLLRLPALVPVILTYILISLCYTLWLKHQPVIDLFTIAFLFVLRVYAGAAAIEVEVSSWMFVTTLCLALYLAAIKRRQELLIWGSDAREVLKLYSVSLVDRYAAMAATGALLFYSLYVLGEHPDMIFTIPFVLYGIFRFWFLAELRQGGDSPTEALLSDWQLLATIGAWVCACAWVLSAPPG